MKQLLVTVIALFSLAVPAGCGQVGSDPAPDAAADAEPDDPCRDGVRDGDETDVDCGGPTCGRCPDGAACEHGPDCLSQVCSPAQDVCISTCTDQVHNGAETGVDCGGPTCDPCGAGAACQQPSDCTSGVCGQDGTCSAASCTDGVRNQGEVDADCGGPCPRCALGATCTGDGDCATYACDQTSGRCVGLPSCLALKDAGALVSGRYAIDIDGTAGPETPFEVYCDMAFDGGGWTLVMKLSSTGNNFSYQSSHWTQPTVFQDGDPAPNTAPAGSEAKYAAFNKLRADTLRAQWLDPQVDWRWNHPPGRTALQLFNQPETLIAGSLTAACHDPSLFEAVPGYDSSVQRNALGQMFFGVNGAVGGNTANGGDSQRMRFGFGSNDESSPGQTWWERQGLGVDGLSLRWVPETDCAVDQYNCGCWGTAYTPPGPTSANLWVR